MKFDAVIGNPPYQKENETDNDKKQTSPLYQTFVLEAIKLKPRYIAMIIPSRWLSAGDNAINRFRTAMVESKHMKCIYNFEMANEVFENVKIAGGVQYFLYDSTEVYEETEIYNCNISDNTVNIKSGSKRSLGEYQYNKRGKAENQEYLIVADNLAVAIIDKTMKLNEKTMDYDVLQVTPFGLVSNFSDSSNKSEDKNIKVICSKGRVTYTDEKCIKQNKEIINKWKVCIGYQAGDQGGTCSTQGNVFAKMLILEPGEVCTTSYNVVGTFETESEASNCITYLRTQLVRYLVSATLSGINMTSKNYMFVPIQNYNKAWTDQELYEKYNISPEEIAIIENKIKAID